MYTLEEIKESYRNYIKSSGSLSQIKDLYLGNVPNTLRTKILGDKRSEEELKLQHLFCLIGSMLEFNYHNVTLEEILNVVNSGERAMEQLLRESYVNCEEYCKLKKYSIQMILGN